MIPKENEKDLEEIPEKITGSLDIRLVEHMDEVLEAALVTADKQEIFSGLRDMEAPDWFAGPDIQDEVHAPH